jgi:hypothetical protein
MGAAQALREEVVDLTVEDFRIQDFRFERDSRIGRDLLFLLSNNDWARRTSENVDVGRVRAVDTELVVDVDLSYVAHEAFRPERGQVWLPILALPAIHAAEPEPPPLPPGRRGRWRRPGRSSELQPGWITSFEVRDGGGDRVTKIPQADVHHCLAAALAEILWPQLRRLADSATERTDPRDQIVMLATAIRLVLQRPLTQARHDRRIDIADVAPTVLDAPVPGEGGLRRFEGRVTAAREALLEVFEADAEQQRPVLDSRVVEIVDALVGTVLVVVAAERGSMPTSYSIRVPARGLVRTNAPGPQLRPQARLRIDLLAATSHADRLVRLNLPVGVSWIPASADATRSGVARIEVLSPLPFDQLRALVGQITASAGPGESTTWVERRLAELAIDKVNASLQSLRYYLVPSDAVPDPDGDPTQALAERLIWLRALLRQVSVSGSVRAPEPLRNQAPDAGKRELQAFWEDGRWLPGRLERAFLANTVGPDAVLLRAAAIEDSTQRAEPTRASLDLDVAVTDSTVLDTARDTNAVNLLLLVVVTGLLTWHAIAQPAGRDLQQDVLATVLTLFPAIQASRIERPDVTTLRGVLTQPGYWLSLATAIPAILLAAALTVVPEPQTVAAALVATGVQGLLHLLISRRARTPAGGTAASRPRFTLSTHAPDHGRFDVLRSTWCRTLTADALNLGRPAHAHVVLGPTGPGSLAELLVASQGGTLPGAAGRAGVDAPAGADGETDTPRAERSRLIERVRERVRERVPGALELIESVPFVARADAAVPEANLLAILRATAVGTSMTLLVFRDPPASPWPLSQPALIRSVPLDVGRLAPSDTAEWIIEVEVGIPRAVLPDLPIGRHPLLHIVHAARASNFRVLLIQYPSPPPRKSTQDQQWMRLRIGVSYRRDDTLAGLHRFLTSVRRLQESGPVAGSEVNVQIVPEMSTFDATATAPEETFARSSAPWGAHPAGDQAGLHAVIGDEVEVPGLAEGSVWRPLALCANARPGLIADALDRLAARRPGIRIAAATSAIVHGLAVTLLLCSDDEASEPDEGHLGDLIALDLAGTDRLEVPIDGRGLSLPSVPSPLPDAPRYGPLLRVQLRAADRPGILQNLLGWLSTTVQRQGTQLGVSTGELDVWSTLMRVVDGRTMQGRLTVRLPSDAAVRRGWETVDWGELARHRTLTGTSGPGRVRPGRGRASAAGPPGDLREGSAPTGSDGTRIAAELDEGSVVSMDLIWVERAVTAAEPQEEEEEGTWRW